MKIHITGNAGAGKTTLAKELGIKLQLPVFHLDQVVWRPYWEKTTPRVRDKMENAILVKPNWIVEGVSSNARSKADLIIFLDVPRYKCIWRCFKRNLAYLFRSRPELPSHCPEIIIVPKLLSIIWRFPVLIRTTLLQEFANSNNMVVIKTSSELDAYLRNLPDA
jgi:adenylate kinase family enzyme